MNPTLQHQTKKVAALIQEYQGGRLAIPEFQRDYVWKKGNAPKLIDSLYRGWPISSLLVWQNDGEEVVPRRAAPTVPRGGLTRWLIDGQQRVTTLSRLMAGDEGIEVVFNAKTEEFRRPNAATQRDPSWVSVTDLWDDTAYREISRALPDDPTGRKRHECYERVRRIRDYEVPIVEMVDHDFASAVEAFKRINTLGYRLKRQDIASAEVAAKHSGFVRHQVIPFLRALHERGFSRIHVMHLFRACAFIAHPDGRRRTPLHELERAEVTRAWKRTAQATEEALRVVSAELGLVDMSVMWSGALLVPIIALCDSAPSKRNPKEMAAWLALATLHHRYSGASDTALDEDLRACRKDDPIGELLGAMRSKNKKRKLLATPDHFSGKLNDRSALLAAWVGCYIRNAEDLLSGGSIILQKGIDRHHIVPRNRFDESHRSDADTIANIGFVSGASNKSLGDDDPGVYLARVSGRILQSQCIPQDRSLWSVHAAERLWAARRQLLADAFNQFVKDRLAGRRL
jgi:hypothetical protein